MELKKPIFFIGVPRSGTTVVFEAIASHTDLGWLSNYSLRFPWTPWVAAVHRIFADFRGRKNQTQNLQLLKRILPEPMEVYNVWERMFGREFSMSFLKDRSPTTAEILRARKFTENLLTSEGKRRFCAKFTGPPRILFLSKVFPDACFVDIVRDPRATVASLLSVGFWKQNGLNRPFWDDGLSAEELAFWEHGGKSPVVLTALQWRAIYRRTTEEISQVRNPFMRIKYEHFMASPQDVMEKTLEFCRLGNCSRVRDYMLAQNYTNMDYKFRKQLTHEDIRSIERITESQMKELEYPV